MTEETVTFHRQTKNVLRVLIKGDWNMSFGLQSPERFLAHIKANPETSHVELDARLLGAWDSSLISYVVSINALSKEYHLKIDITQLPEGIVRLVALAEAVPEREGAAKIKVKPAFVDDL